MGIINFENYFNDKRLRGKKGASILDFLKREMRVIMQKADTWKEQMGYYRFWENKKVTEEELKECAVKQCAEQSAEMEEVHLLEDTTGINLERHRERIKDKGGLGSNYGRRGKGRQNKKEVLYFPRNNWNAWRSCLADMKAKGRNKGILMTGKI
jgi:hypothetical protein